MQGGAVDIQCSVMKLQSGPTKGATKAVLSSIINFRSNEVEWTAASPTTTSSMHRSSSTTGTSTPATIAEALHRNELANLDSVIVVAKETSRSTNLGKSRSLMQC